jgi:3-oxoadipate enol-lactonase
MVTTPQQCIRDRFQVPDLPHVAPFTLDLPGRGATLATDTGPRDAPAVLLLHAVGCTGLLTWFPAIDALSERYRVVTFDQRWHGRGIQSERFSLPDCADDAAAVIETLDLRDVVVAGFSMGSIVAQRVWRQHPELTAGLVLAATTDRFQSTLSERIFHQAMGLSMGATRTLARSRSVRRAGRGAAEALSIGPSDTHRWALEQWRSTSPWAVAQAVAALGRHHSRPWLGQIDVPTAVVVTERDHVLPPERQRALASRIEGATLHPVQCGHAGCVLEADAFVPVFVEAVDVTAARVRDRRPPVAEEA